MPWLGPYPCSPGSLQPFPEHPRCPGCLLQAHFPQPPTPGRLWFCHIPSQNVLLISHPRWSLDRSPSASAPPARQPQGSPSSFPHCDLVPMSPARAAGPPRLLPSVSLSASRLYSSSSLHLFPPPLPALNLPMTPIVLLRAPWHLELPVTTPRCAEPLLEPCSGHGTLRLHSHGKRKATVQSPSSGASVGG